jgi:hypothetical protein
MIGGGVTLRPIPGAISASHYRHLRRISLYLARNASLERPSTMTDSQSPGAAAPSNSKPDTTGFIPGDDTWTQFRNIYSILTGKMSNEGIEQFRVARDDRNEAADCKRCEDQRDYLLQYSE